MVTSTSGAGRSRNACPTTRSASLSVPYVGATSRQVMPASIAACTVATASARSVAPSTPPMPPAAQRERADQSEPSEVAYLHV